MSDMSDLNHNNNNEHPNFNEISGEEKLQALRDLIELTDNHLTQQVLEGNAYILVRGAAFAILVAHQQVNGAASTLESLQSDPDFGSSAMRVLHSNQGSYNQ
ncbi:hypothetical protein [Paenibacillus sp. FSL R7-0026]|uniref:hypothetical protein n=1 Tax=Paenibacillus sp. FSL R7-0026 TaxID=2921668 RepID=UPI0030FC004D